MVFSDMILGRLRFILKTSDAASLENAKQIF